MGRRLLVHLCLLRVGQSLLGLGMLRVTIDPAEDAQLVFSLSCIVVCERAFLAVIVVIFSIVLTFILRDH